MIRLRSREFRDLRDIFTSLYFTDFIQPGDKMSAQVIPEVHPIPCKIFSDSKIVQKISYPKLSEVYNNLITREEVEDLVKKSVSSGVELVDYNLRQYSEEKLGFLGSHLCLTVVFRKLGNRENETRSFFVKAVPFDVPSQATYILEKGCFRKESDFFGQLVPLMMDDFKGESWAPKCHLAKENVLIFEDLKMSGFANRSKSFDEKSLMAALACIARFHATSLLAEERIQGKPLNAAFPNLLEESVFKRSGLSYMWYSTAINLAVALADEMGLDSSSIKQASDRLFDICAPSKTKRNVVSHGDIWGSNVMFDKNDRCYLIDFQLIRYSPLAHDVMQLLYLCASKELRQKHERRMIEHYYQVLIDTLKKNNYEREVPCFKEVLQGAEEQRFGALVVAMIFHPTALMDGKTAAKIMNDTETYEAYHFKDRKPFVDEIMANNSEYAQKLRESARELAEMSLIVDSLPRPT